MIYFALIWEKVSFIWSSGIYCGGWSGLFPLKHAVETEIWWSKISTVSYHLSCWKQHCTHCTVYISMLVFHGIKGQHCVKCQWVFFWKCSVKYTTGKYHMGRRFLLCNNLPLKNYLSQDLEASAWRHLTCKCVMYNLSTNIWRILTNNYAVVYTMCKSSCDHLLEEWKFILY